METLTVKPFRICVSDDVLAALMAAVGRVAPGRYAETTVPGHEL